jgi:hypothetical protein
MYRVKGNPNTLVGTLGYFKYASKQSPKTLEVGKENLQPGGVSYGIEFINRHRKR